MTKFGLLFSIIILVSQLAWGQASTGDYRSNAATGNWGTLATWQMFNGTTWVAPASVPSSASGVITIRSGHIVSIVTSRTADQIVIDPGGQITITPLGTLTIADGDGTDLIVNGTVITIGTITRNGTISFESGSIYRHQKNGGTIPTATWNSNSTCLITGIVNTVPSGMGQTFGNLTWNCDGQLTSDPLSSLFTLNGNFTVTSTGTSAQLRLASGTTNIAGNYSQTGGSIIFVKEPAGTINVGGDFSLTGGTCVVTENEVGTINVAGDLTHTAGTITEIGTNGNIVFNGNGIQNYTGGGTISNTIDFTINNPAGITLLSSATFPAALTMTNGNIALNGNTLTLGTSTANRGTLNWTNGFMVGSGSFTRWFSTSAIILGNVLGLFPMGNGTDNRSVWIGGTPSTGGTVSVQHANATGTTALSFTENSQNFDKRTNMSWTLSNTNGFAGSSMSLRIQGSGIPGINVVSDLNICVASGISGGTYAAPGGSITDPQVNRTVLTQTTLANTFYFASTSGSPLPVELSSFSASVIGSAVKLSWRTETEVNNYGFEILRQGHSSTSLSVTDWEKIGFVEGYGNSNSPKDYSFTDASVVSGSYSYRLKQIDNDGQFEYSKTIEVDLGAPQKYELAQNFPNPFNPNTSIRFSLPETGYVKLTVYNMLGQEIATLVNGVKEAGTHIINFNAEELNSGVYIYCIECNGFNEVRKMTLIK